LRRHLATVLPTLQRLPGVVGITLNGGLARGYGDHLSEIDVTIYLTAAMYAAWQCGQSPIATGITVIDGQLYDLKMLDYAAAMAQAWSDDTMWDGSYAEILYDPEGLLAQLHAAKVTAPPAPETAGGLMMSCWWYFRLAGDIWIYRGDPLQGHHMLNQAIIPLVKALFVANGEWIPHEKWLLHMSRTLAWQPPQWTERLPRALSTGDFSITSLQQRQQMIEALWTELDCYLVQRYWPDLPVHVMQRSFYTLFEQLNRQGCMSRAAWTAAGGDALFNVDPFHKVVTVDEEWITLDRQRLLDLNPTTMYAWHFAVAAAVRNS
jgi:hypothetical protein